MLPDESGSVQVSSAMPARQRNATFHQHLQSQGGTVFDGQHVRLGSAREAGAGSSARACRLWLCARPRLLLASTPPLPST